MPDDFPPDLERLIDSLVETGVSWIRCECRNLVKVEIPAQCGICGKIYPYWVDINGRRWSLEEMTLGHLNNCVRMVGRRVEEGVSAENRRRCEIALDIFYAEIGSREKELIQLAGIQAALDRSLKNAD